jgi:hypothetical protein
MDLKILSAYRDLQREYERASNSTNGAGGSPNPEPEGKARAAAADIRSTEANAGSPNPPRPKTNSDSAGNGSGLQPNQFGTPAKSVLDSGAEIGGVRTENTLSPNEINADSGALLNLNTLSSKTGDHHQIEFKQKEGFSKAQSVVEDLQVSSRPKAEPENQSHGSQRIADDEKPKTGETIPARELLDDPQAEFHLRLEERHGKGCSIFEREEWFREVSGDLANNGIPLSEFLEFDTAKTTNPARLTNPAGHYRTLVKKMANARKAAVMKAAMDLNRKVSEFLNEKPPAMPAGPTCPKCSSPVGRGLRLVKGEDGKSKFDFCECATEEFREEWAVKEARREQQRTEMKAERAKAAEAKLTEVQSQGKQEAAYFAGG